MTVAELVAKLQSIPEQDLPVCLSGDDCHCYELTDVVKVVKEYWPDDTIHKKIHGPFVCLGDL